MYTQEPKIYNIDEVIESIFPVIKDSAYYNEEHFNNIKMTGGDLLFTLIAEM